MHLSKVTFIVLLGFLGAYGIDFDKCHQGDAVACFDIGAMYYDRGDYTLAANYFEQACDLDAAGGCSNLGMLYRQGKGVLQDNEQARTYYKKSCDLNFAEGCHNLGVIYNNGYGVTENLSMAKF